MLRYTQEVNPYPGAGLSEPLVSFQQLLSTQQVRAAGERFQPFEPRNLGPAALALSSHCRHTEQYVQYGL